MPHEAQSSLKDDSSSIAEADIGLVALDLDNLPLAERGVGNNVPNAECLVCSGKAFGRFVIGPVC